MRGRSGGKASRNSRRKVTLAILSYWRFVSLENIACFLKWFKLFTQCSTEKWKFVSVVVTVSFPDLQVCVLSSVELQVLTSSCFKLRTVHNIPVTSNKDGRKLLHKHLFLFLSSCVWTLSMFLLRSPLFSAITNIRSHCSFLSSVFSLNSYTKAPFTLSAQKSHIMRDRGGLCRRECRLQCVSHPACSSQCHAVCRLWPALSSQLLHVCIRSRSPRCTAFRAWWWH